MDKTDDFKERFRKAEEALLKSNEELERRVQERTLELSRSEEKYHNLFDSATDGIFVLDLEGDFIDLNATAYKRMGYTKDEMLSMNISDLTPPESAIMVPERLSEIQDKGVAIFESVHRRKDGTLMHVEVNARLLEHEGKQALFSIVRDITERREAENRLRESEARFRGAFESAAVGASMASLKGRFIRVNRFLCDMLGYSEEELLAKTFSDVTHPEDVEIGLDAAKKLVAGEIDYTMFEKRYVRKDGKLINVVISPTVIRDSNGAPLHFFALFQDITERKEAENKLRESEDRFRTIFEQATDGIMIADLKSNKQIEANRAACAMLGYTRDELLALYVEDLHPKEDMPRIVDVFKRQARGEISLAHDIPVLRKDGSVIYADVNAARMTLNGRQCMMGIFRDITERKRADAALRESERQLSESQRIAHIGSWEHNLTTNKVVWSDELFLLLGLDPEKDPGDFNAFFNMIHPEDQPLLKKAIEETLRTGKHFSVEYRFNRKDGKTRMLHAQAELISDPTGTQKILSGTGQDITERKRMEDELKATNRMLQNLIQAIPDMVFYRDIEGRLLMANKVMAETVGYSSVQDVIGKTNYDLLPPEAVDLCNKSDEAAKMSGSPTHSEESVTYADGRTKYLDTIKTCMYDDEGNYTGLLAISRDITERKEAENKIKEALREKEVLLKEIHHRVKNNMAIVSALLKLQSRYSGDSETRKILEDCQNRINSMALVHEKLYESENLSSISVKDYLKELVDHLSDGYASQEIRFELEVGDMQLDIDHIIPLGLILNELLTNSIKHAFSGNESPEIVIRLRAGEGIASLTYRDNGPGLPEGLSMRDAESLGLKIIYMLSNQLKGTISLDEKDRSRYTLSFPI